MKWIAPNACVFCGMRLPEDDVPICRGCHSDLPCATRSLVLPDAPLTFMLAPLEYRFPVDAAIKAWKFRRRLDYTPAFVAVLIEALAALPERPDALLPVPLHWHRQALRGFNQADELAVPLARSLGIPVLRNVRRVRHTPPQSELGAGERRKNLNAAFRLCDRIRARHVLLVDDVVTTGATSMELARAALRAGAEKVSVLAVARSVMD
jgi:ComF family protein